jgi:hypothetical protein
MRRLAMGLAAVTACTALALPVWGQSATTDPAPLIAALVQGKSTQARIDAARALGASADRRAVEPLVKTLEDANRDVRWAAIEALGELGDRRAVAPLIAFLKKPEPYRWGTRLVANALGALGDPVAIEPLGGLLVHEDPFVRRTAALALLRIDDPRAVQKVTELVKKGPDDTLITVRRELARVEDGKRRPTTAPAPIAPVAPPVAPRPHEWAGIKVGESRMADARQRLGVPLQDTPEFALFSAERVTGPLRTDSLVVNADTRGMVESIFVFPVWGTLDRDVRSVLGQGKIMAYERFLASTGRTVSGAGTRAREKLHYVAPNVLTESYPEMGILVVYDGPDQPAGDRIVKLLIVY